MSRPSKLSDKQWAEIERRVPPNGLESVRSVAKEFEISEGAIRQRISTHIKPIKILANQLAANEIELEKLPLATQLKVRSLADRLKGISTHLSSAAENGAMTAHRLSILANTEVQKIDDENPFSSIENLKGVAVLTELANKASMIGLNLLNANKDLKMPMDNENLSLTAAELKRLTPEEYAVLKSATAKLLSE